MKVKPFFDQATSTFTYVVNDENTKKCAVIDPVIIQFRRKVLACFILPVVHIEMV